MGANCCGEEQKVGGGFVDSLSQDFNALQMVPVDDQLRNKNLSQYPQAAPRGNYGTRSNQRPKLFYLVEDSRKRQLESRPLGAPKTYGVSLPVYYLKKFNAYYEGEWDAGQPSGLGKLYFANGAYLQGPFESGNINGQDGIYIYPDGSFKRGHIANGKLEGYAKYVSRSGNFIYEGNWVNDQPNGRGVQIYPDGSRYQGQFLNGIKNDNNATYRWPNGKTYVGPFKNGYMEGHGKLTMNNGKGQYIGEFSRNLKVGHGKMRTQTGTYTGPFQNGEMHGLGSFVWDDGKIYEGQFQNGQLHGNGVMYYPNGQMVKGVWHRGQNLQMQKVDIGKSQLRI